MSRGSSSADFWTPKSLARYTKDMPPRMLLPPRMAEVRMRNTPEGMMGWTTYVSEEAVVDEKYVSEW